MCTSLQNGYRASWYRFIDLILIHCAVLSKTDIPCQYGCFKVATDFCEYLQIYCWLLRKEEELQNEPSVSLLGHAQMKSLIVSAFILAIELSNPLHMNISTKISISVRPYCIAPIINLESNSIRCRFSSCKVDPDIIFIVTFIFITYSIHAKTSYVFLFFDALHRSCQFYLFLSV